MYKVFVNDRPIILTEDENFCTDYRKALYSHVHICDLLTQFFNSDLPGICLICNDLTDCWRHFKAYFKVQKSAGGKVFNKNGEILFIYRFDRWDLPKGKLEKGEKIEECAVREVEEECGIDQLKILKQLETTYHIFDFKGIKILKQTYWFLMETEFSGKPVPQTEESITIAEFKNPQEVEKALKNTYENIRILFP